MPTTTPCARASLPRWNVSFWSGAGLRLTPDAAPEAMRAALTTLLADTQFTDSAKHLGATIAAAEHDTALVDELEALAACLPHCAAA